MELPFLLVTAYADVRDAVLALKLGAVDYLEKPVVLDELVSCVREALGMGFGDDAQDPPAEAVCGIVAQSPIMRAVLRDAWYIAKSDATVLITGESGTGKEVVAEFIHRNSTRGDKALVAVNCASLPASLMSSELFGHERGAFTGALSRRPGKFREAHGGTLFLDEIGDMPLELQPVLLRAIEGRRITPVGASGEVEVDFRLIAATNRDLEQSIQDGTFRSDLFYRLNVIMLTLSPLRERPEDILPMARRFLAASQGKNKRLSRATTRILESYPWPGNARELKNAMERARLLSRGDVILPEHLPAALRKAGLEAKSIPEAPTAGFQTLQEREIETVRRALEATQGNRTKAAALLGITRRGLFKKMKRFGLQ